MIYKRGKVYWYKFVFNGTLIRESTKQGNDKVARQMEAAHRTSLAKGEVGIREKKPVPTLAEFSDSRVDKWVQASYSAAKTSQWYQFGLKSMKSFKPLASAKLSDIDADLIARFKADRQAKGWEISSINSVLRALRRVLNLAVEWNVIDKMPTKIAFLSGEQHRERVLTPGEETRYLEKALPLLRDVASVLFDTGLRPEECHELLWEHIHWQTGPRTPNGWLFVARGKTKAARRALPLTARSREVLNRRWEDAGKPEHGWVWPADSKSGHMNHSSLRLQHKKACKNAKVREFVIYSIRHTFLTRLGESGADVWTLAKIAGHSSIQMSLRYVHPSAQSVLNAVERTEQLRSEAEQEKKANVERQRELAEAEQVDDAESYAHDEADEEALSLVG